MERQQLDQDALDFIAQQRAYHKDQADRGDDDYLPEKDRRNREHVLGPYCRVQADDDVMHNGQAVRVICPARDERWFYAFQAGPFGNADVPMDGQYITDRAPEDPNDDPLPIRLPEPEPEEPPPEGPPLGGAGEGDELEPEPEEP